MHDARVPAHYYIIRIQPSVETMAERALMFVHMGVDVENQWGRAVAALEHMSNLEIALVWRRLSGYVYAGDFKTHSEYKCLFKRALREAERHMRMNHQNCGGTGGMFCGLNPSSFTMGDGMMYGGDAFSDGGLTCSERYDFDRTSQPGSVKYGRGNSGISETESYRERANDARYARLIETAIQVGVNVGMNRSKVLEPLPDQGIDLEQVEKYCEGIIALISEQGMRPETRLRLLEKE